MEFIISQDLKSVLHKMQEKSVIARDLLQLKDTDECKTWINFLGIAEDDPTKISYLNEGRYKEIEKNLAKPILKAGSPLTEISTGTIYYSFDTETDLEKNDYIYLSEKEGGAAILYVDTSLYNISEYRLKDRTWDSTFRYMASCGKLIVKIFGVEKYSGKEMSLFCEHFTAGHPLNSLEEGREVRFVTGEDIRYWYLEDNYYGEEDVDNSLWLSCMRHEQCQSYFDVYVENDKQISMFIVLVDNLLVGRCIVWENKFFDRVYSIDDRLTASIIQYLLQKGLIDIYNAGIKYKIKLDVSDFDYYPYMDTMLYLVEDTLYSYDPDHIQQRELDCDDGNPAPVWSDYEQEYIVRDEANYSNAVNSYISDYKSLVDIYGDYIPNNAAIKLLGGEYSYKDNSELIELFDGNYAVTDDSTYDIVKLHNGEYACKNHHNVTELISGKYALDIASIHSTYHNGYILIAEAEKVERDWILTSSLNELDHA